MRVLLLLCLCSFGCAKLTSPDELHLYVTGGEQQKVTEWEGAFDDTEIIMLTLGLTWKLRPDRKLEVLEELLKEQKKSSQLRRDALQSLK